MTYYHILHQKIKKLKKQHLIHLRKELNRIKEGLIKLGALKIIIFGSAVRNELGLTSDIDLIVIIETNKNFIERAEEIYKNLAPIDIDLLIYTPNEFDRMNKENLFLQHVLKEGKVIYEQK